MDNSHHNFYLRKSKQSNEFISTSSYEDIAEYNNNNGNSNNNMYTQKN